MAKKKYNNYKAGRGRRRNNIFYRRGLKKAVRLAGYLNVEFKTFDVFDTDNVTDGLTIVQLSNIAQGDTGSTRDGDSCKVVKLLLSFTAKINASATNSFVRVMLIRDDQTNGAIFTTANLLEGDEYLSPINARNTDRFVVYYDKLFALSNTGAGCVKDNMNKECSFHIQFGAATAAITSLRSKSLALCFISDESTNYPTIDYRSRLTYVDN
jgi:hypothetical protein